MVHIYYHIYAFKNAFEIVKEQINYIQNSFKSKIKVNIVITTPDRLGRMSMNDCSSEIYDWLSKEILTSNENYVIRDYIISEEIRPTEWATLDFIIKDRELFSKDDFILYLTQYDRLRVPGIDHIINNMENIKNFMLTKSEYLISPETFKKNNMLDKIRGKEFLDYFPEHENMKEYINE